MLFASRSECAEMVPTFCAMDINAINSQFFNVDFRSVCGCRFNLAGGVDSTAIHIATEDTKVGRMLEPAVEKLVGLRDWLVLVAREFAQFAHSASSGKVAQAPLAFYESEDLPLTLEAAPVDGHPDHVRLEFTLLSDDNDSLDYCHIAVTVDLALREFLDEVARAAATGGDLCEPA